MGEKQHFPCREYVFHSRLWVLVVMITKNILNAGQKMKNKKHKNARKACLPDIDKRKN